MQSVRTLANRARSICSKIGKHDDFGPKIPTELALKFLFGLCLRTPLCGCVAPDLIFTCFAPLYPPVAKPFFARSWRMLSFLSISRVASARRHRSLCSQQDSLVWQPELAPCPQRFSGLCVWLGLPAAARRGGRQIRTLASGAWP